MTTGTLTTVRQCDDSTGLNEIYPLHDVDSLTAEQDAALGEATRMAMRPLVEQAWARRGYAVQWVDLFAHPMDYVPVGTEVTDEYAAEQLAYDMQAVEVSVWGEAYENLDTDALWSSVVGDVQNEL